MAGTTVDVSSIEIVSTVNPLLYLNYNMDSFSVDFDDTGNSLTTTANSVTVNAVSTTITYNMDEFGASVDDVGSTFVITVNNTEVILNDSYTDTVQILTFTINSPTIVLNTTSIQIDDTSTEATLTMNTATIETTSTQTVIVEPLASILQSTQLDPTVSISLFYIEYPMAGLGKFISDTGTILNIVSNTHEVGGNEETIDDVGVTLSMTVNDAIIDADGVNPASMSATFSANVPTIEFDHIINDDGLTVTSSVGSVTIDVGYTVDVGNNSAEFTVNVPSVANDLRVDATTLTISLTANEVIVGAGETINAENQVITLTVNDVVIFAFIANYKDPDVNVHNRKNSANITNKNNSATIHEHDSEYTPT